MVESLSTRWRSRVTRPEPPKRLTLQTPKVTDSWEKVILELRESRNLGAKRIQAELIRQHNFKLSTATIARIFSKNKVKTLLGLRTKQKPHRYNRPVPGDRIQIDTTKIANGIYQYTAIDDCTRFRVLGIYSRRTAQNSVHFLEERMLEEFPFPIQRIQTDRGTEFFGLEFQSAMRRYGIKFRPNKPRSPHLNGKVERSQMTDKVEFYPTVNLADENLADQLEEWQFAYNWHRPHSWW
jgi:transposase InsO family protein